MQLRSHGTARVIGRRIPGSDTLVWLVGLEDNARKRRISPSEALDAALKTCERSLACDLRSPCLARGRDAASESSQESAFSKLSMMRCSDGSGAQLLASCDSLPDMPGGFLFWTGTAALPAFTWFAPSPHLVRETGPAAGAGT